MNKRQKKKQAKKIARKIDNMMKESGVFEKYLMAPPHEIKMRISLPISAKKYFGEL